MLLLSVASKETINAESLKVLLLTSFKFTKLSLSNPTSNLCLFNCKTLRYWFILVWCSMNSVNIRAHHTSWTNTLLTYIQGSKKLRLRQNAIRCRHGTWGGFGVQISKLPTFPMLPHLKHENDVTYWYHIDTLKDHASPTFCGQTKLRIPKNLKDHCSRSYLYTIVVWSIIVNANSLPTCILIAVEAPTITLLGGIWQLPFKLVIGINRKYSWMVVLCEFQYDWQKTNAVH